MKAVGDLVTLVAGRGATVYRITAIDRERASLVPYEYRPGVVRATVDVHTLYYARATQLTPRRTTLK